MTTPTFKKLIVLILSAISLAVISNFVIAADFRTSAFSTELPSGIVIEGEIEPGDFETFIEIVRRSQGEMSQVYLLSPGGDYDEAMKIGRAMRALNLDSRTPMITDSGRPSCESDMMTAERIDSTIKPKDPKNCTCASACFFIHIGATYRGGNFLAVHRPYFGKGAFGKLSQTDAKVKFDALLNSARVYMLEMGVPKHVQEEILATPSNETLVLDEKTVMTYFQGDLPYKSEWLKNKCSKSIKLSAAEKRSFDKYYSRIVAFVNGSGEAPSKAEMEILNALSKKQREGMSCGIEANNKARLEAYESYFGEKPTDYEKHDFKKWSEATKYLGKRFYTLLSEERFEKEPRFLSTGLTRDATESTPYIQMHDSESSPKVVTSMSLISAKNPSSEFKQRLLSSLEKAWGKGAVSNKSAFDSLFDPDGNTYWYWNKKEFSAELEFYIRPDGPHKGTGLSLSIKAK